jgi:hypothetical protein
VWKSESKHQFIVRKTATEPISFFCMFPHGPNKIGMFYERLSFAEQKKNKTMQDLEGISDALWYVLGKHVPNSPDSLVFIDGSWHDDCVNTLVGRYDYLCPSDGYPQPKNDGWMYVCVWALDAWNEIETYEGLKLLCNDDITLKGFKYTFYVCGGKHERCCSCYNLRWHGKSEGTTTMSN